MDHLECSMDMKSRKQEYYRATGAAKRPSRRKMLGGRSFVRIWMEKMGRGMCLG